MEAKIQELKEAVRRNRLSSDEMFELLADEPCAHCCKTSGGGNGSCPPPSELD